MPGSVSIVETYEPVEVDLWGTPFKTQPLTRSLDQKIDGFQDKIDQAEDADQIVAAVAELLDIRLVPLEGTKKASTVIKDKWKKDALTTAQLLRFLGNLEEADRPT